MPEITSPLPVLDWLLTRGNSVDDREIPSLASFKELFDDATAHWDAPSDRAIIGGFIADRVAYAFAAGYECALRKLVPALPSRALVSFCVTEEKGGHPASIRSTLRRDSADADWKLSGVKKFITLADAAELILVAASTGSSPDGKNLIRMALVPRAAEGVEVRPMAPLPFIPEIPHGSVIFRDVTVEDQSLLPGDGYRNYIKPFRTIEDLHVLSAVGGHLFRTGCRYRWPAPIREQIASFLVCARALAADDPASPATHIALGGLNAQANALFETIEPHWESVDIPVREGWKRDRQLLGIAGAARKKRLERAWSHYGEAE